MAPCDLVLFTCVLSCSKMLNCCCAEEQRKWNYANGSEVQTFASDLIRFTWIMEVRFVVTVAMTFYKLALLSFYFPFQ